MAVTKISGTKSVVHIGGAKVENLKSAELTIDQDELDTTDNDSANSWREFIMGLRSGSFRFTCNWDAAFTSPATQQIPFTEISATTPTAKAFIFYPNGTASTNRRYSFSGYIKSVSHPSANNTVVEFSCDVRINGAITVDAVP